MSGALAVLYYYSAVFFLVNNTAFYFFHIKGSFEALSQQLLFPVGVHSVAPSPCGQRKGEELSELLKVTGEDIAELDTRWAELSSMGVTV